MATYQIETDKGTYQVDTESSSNGLTGNSTIDMKGANEELAQAQQDVKDVNRPLGELDKVTGWPYTNSKNIANNVGGVINSLTHPVDTASGLLKSFTHPVDALSQHLSRYSPDNIKSTLSSDPIGVMLDASMVGGLGTLGVKSAIKSIPKTTPEQLVGEAEGITQRILNPSKQEIADSLLKNSKIPAVREAAKIIKKSPTEQSLLNSINDAINTNFTERNNILKNNNYRMTDNHIKGLEDFINTRKAQGQVNDSELSQMNNVLSAEKAWYVQNKNSFDRIAGQGRKQELQDLTETLIERRNDGSQIITQPARKQALDVLRSGLMKEVEGNDLRVKNLNATYGGLKDAKEMIANQAAIIQQNAHKGIVERLLLMAQSAVNPQAAAINAALNNAKHISKLSSQVEKLMQKANKNKISQIMQNSIDNEKPVLGIPDLTPKYLKERQNMKTELGTTRGKSFTEKGVPQKESIPSPGYVPPSLPSPESIHSKILSIRPELKSKYDTPYNKARSIEETIHIDKQPTQKEIDIVNSNDPRNFRERNLILKRYGIKKGEKNARN